MSVGQGEQEIRIERIVIRDPDLRGDRLRGALSGELRRHGVMHPDAVAATLVEELAARRADSESGATL